MDPVVVGILCMVGFIGLMFFGVPVPFAMLFPGVIGLSIILNPAAAIQTMSYNLFSWFSNYALTVGPMFGLMGFFASYSGLGAKLFNTLDSFMGHKKGGLAQSTVVACAGFGAINGNVAATIVTMSAVAYPEMRKKGYSPSLAGPVIAAAPMISVLIPPSSTMIIYGMAAETSINRLFLGGVVPGLLCTATMCFACWWVANKRPEWAPTTERSSWKERIHNLTHGGLIEIIIIFLLAMGGMFAGFFTATEAGAVGGMGMLLISLIRKNFDRKRFMKAIIDGVKLAAMVYMLMGCASVFGKMFTVSKIPAILGGFIQGLNVPGWTIMAVVILIYFILGMLADLTSMMLATLPMFYPIVVDYLGYSPVWFGVCLTILIGVGAITPPVGNGIFLTSGLVSTWDKEATIASFFRGVIPFCVAAIAVVLLMIFFPSVVTWLPDLVYGT